MLPFRQLAALIVFSAALLVSRSSAAQIAPTGAHYAGRPSDTGHAGPNDSGGYAASIPLDLPASRGGLPLPLQVSSGAKGFGAAGVGWDVPLSYVLVDRSFVHRRPAMTPGATPTPRERITVSLLGQRVEMIRSGNQWTARHAPDLAMRREGNTWVVVDGNGRSFTFTQHALLAGTGGPFAGSGGMWLLDSIRGDGGSVVKLRYEIASVIVPKAPSPQLPDASFLPSPSPAISIDLVGLAYNPGASAGCFKHEVALHYDGIVLGARPDALSVVGSRILARWHKLVSIEVSSRASCGDAPQRLRRYHLAYATDPDTRQQRLEAVRMFGREGTPEATVALPVARYTYGTATTPSNGVPVLRYAPALLSAPIPVPGNGEIAQTADTGPALFQPPIAGGGPGAASLQSFTDFTGDGRPDLVFTNNGGLSIARGLDGLALGAAVPLTDNTFTRPALDIRMLDVARFTDESSVRMRHEYVWTQSIDVNGDGRIDVIDAAEQPETWVVYLNTPDPGPSGIKWVRRTWDISRLRNIFRQRRLVEFENYLPLGHRVTGRNHGEWKCWMRTTGTSYVTVQLGGCPEYDPSEAPLLGPQQTFVEYEVKDINGDGYPDVIFDSSPVGWTVAPSVELAGAERILGQLISSLGPRSSAGPNQVLAVLNVGGLAIKNGTDPFSSPIELLTSDCGVGRWEGSERYRWVGDATSHDRLQTQTCGFAEVNGDGILDRFEEGSALLGTGSGFDTVRIELPWSPDAPRIFAQQRSEFVDKCLQPGPLQWLTARQIVGLRDLTGDGIPDYITPIAGSSRSQVFVGTGAGFAATPSAINGTFSISTVEERCDGAFSNTQAGLVDVNGDGKPDVIKLEAGGIVVHQLAGGVLPGKPEAGRIVIVDNGYGATTSIRYGSAKDDTRTRHQVPFPEIVVTSTQTTGAKNLGGTLASTHYAYGDIELFYDSTLDTFRSSGYRRSVELIGAPAPRAPPIAKIVDRYPLDAITPNTLWFLTDAQRLGRYLRAGRVRDVTVLAGGLGIDARALLAVDVTADPRRISGVHYTVDTHDTRLLSGNPVTTADCTDVMFPYNFALSAANNLGAYNPCSSRGFLVTSSTHSWRGSAAPPASQNVQAATSIRRVDDFGRVTSVFHHNDLFRSDDDVCVDTTYAAPIALDRPVRTAIGSRRIWACGRGNDVLAYEAFGYDGLFPGLVTLGRPTSHLVFRHTTDTAAYLSTVRDFDAEYDANGNPIEVVTQRSQDGAHRMTQISYDPFGLAPESAQVSGTNVASIGTTWLTDSISGEIVGTKDTNGTVRGKTFDGFGRPVLETITTPSAAASGVLVAHTYLGFDGIDPAGRRVSVKDFTDPVAASAVITEPGRTSTSYFDELGRLRLGHVELGDDYAKEILVVGARIYDPLGRVVFEADAYPISQNAATAYGTTRYFARDGSLAVEIRGFGPQSYTTTPSPAEERFPSVFGHSFANHLETTIVQGADALSPGSPQYGVTRQAVSTAIGRVLTRSTWRGAARLEHEALGYDRLGQHASLIRYQNAAVASGPVVWRWQLDSIGQLLWLNEPSSAPQQRDYSDWGELTATTWYPTVAEPTRGVAMAYDALGRLLSSVERDGGVPDPATSSKYRYDAPGSSPFMTPTHVAGRLSSATTATSHVALSYDGFGRVDARSFTDDTFTPYFERRRFHGDGSQASIELRLPDNAYQPERVDYAYDSAGRVRRMQFSTGASTQQLYNATTLDAWGRIRTASFGQTQYAANHADIGRRLPKAVTASSPHGARSIEYTSFDSIGRELARAETLPNSPGLQVQSYDPLGRLQESRRTQGGTPTAHWSFAYDPLGNVTQLNDQLGTANAALSFVAQDRDRICAIAYGGIPGLCNVDHDSVGNIILQPTRTGYNKLAYGSSGNVRRIENESGVTASFRYDAFGEVSDLSIVQGTTELRRDRRVGGFITARAHKGPLGSLQYIARRFPGPGLAVSRHGSTGPWLYAFGESRGTRFTTDESGRFVQDLSYAPFGQTTSSGAAPGAVAFTSEQWNQGDALDGFGLVRLGKRLYAPSIGRFLSRDPLMILRTAATSNPYAFAFNDPVSFSDPSGLDPCSVSGNCIWGSSGGLPSSGTPWSTPWGPLAIGLWALGDYLWDQAGSSGWPQTQAGADLYMHATFANAGFPAPTPTNFNWDTLALSGATPGEALALASDSTPATVLGGLRATAESVASLAPGLALGPLIPARIAFAIGVGLGGKDLIQGIWTGDAWQIVSGVSNLAQGALASKLGFGRGDGALTAPRGRSELGGVVSSRTNSAGGEIYTADGLVSAKDFDGIVAGALQYGKGPVTVISGAHGFPSGAIQRDPRMLKTDTDNWGAMGATILDVANPALAGAITGALRGPGTTIGAFCFSGVCLDRFY